MSAPAQKLSPSPVSTTVRASPTFAKASVSSRISSASKAFRRSGFASVLLSGLLWAWVYEKTGSLLPGMIAHAANNLAVAVTLLALLRG